MLIVPSFLPLPMSASTPPLLRRPAGGRAFFLEAAFDHQAQIGAHSRPLHTIHVVEWHYTNFFRQLDFTLFSNASNGVSC